MNSVLPSQLESIVQDMRRAFSASLYYPALLVALTLPEVCAALAMDDRTFVKEAHYSAFIDKYTIPRELGLDGIYCYRLRGGIVHRGNASGHPLFGSTHVIFTVPETGPSIHALTIESGDKTSDMIDLKRFCDAMERAVRSWYADHRLDPKVASNIQRLLSWRPDGVSPFLRGAPVIASGL